MGDGGEMQIQQKVGGGRWLCGGAGTSDDTVGCVKMDWMDV